MAHSRAGEVAEAHDAFSQAAQIALSAKLNFAAVPFLCNLAEVQISQPGSSRPCKHAKRPGD